MRKAPKISPNFQSLPDSHYDVTVAELSPKFASNEGSLDIFHQDVRATAWGGS